MSHNIDQLFSQFQGDEDILVEIYKEFRDNLDEYFSNIEDSLSAQNSEDLRLHAHTLKGVMRNFYYEPAIQYLSELEIKGRDGDFNEVDDLYENSKKQVINFINEFDEYIQGQQAA